MLLFDNALGSNYEEIKTWYPVFYREVLEMDALWRVYGGHLDDIQAGLIRAVDNNFIETADERTISRYEKFLSLTYDRPRTLEERRTVIRALLMGRGHIGQKEIKEIISLFTDMAMTVRLVGGTIRITSQYGIGAIIPDVRLALQRWIPAHLALDLQFFNPHSYVGGFTHRFLSNFTHWQIRNERLYWDDTGNRHIDLEAFTYEELEAYTHWQLEHERLDGGTSPPEPPDPPDPPVPVWRPPWLSVPSGTFFLGISPEVVKPYGFEDMTVFYIINNDFSRFILWDGEPFNVSENQTITLFGVLGTKTTDLNTFEYIIEQPSFREDVVPVGTDFTDSAEIQFNDTVNPSFAETAALEVITAIDNVQLTIDN